MSSFYYPIRLYYTGKIEFVNVLSKRSEFIPSKDGGFTYYLVKTKELDFTLTVNMAKFKKVHSGQVLKIFVNRKMKEAIVLFDEKPTLLQCFKKGDYDLILGLFFGTMLLIITFYVFVWTGKFVYKDFINLVNAHAHEKMLLRIVNISKQAVPYVTILIFLYIVVIITVKASFLVENGNRSVTGFILLCGLVFSSLAPRLIIGFKTFINNNYYAKVIIGLGKFIFSLVGSIKSYYFLHGKNLTEFNNISDVLKALLEYLVDF